MNYPKTPFLGVAYVARSKTLADQQCINLFPEIVESKSGAAVGAFYGCPGLLLQLTVDGGPIRGMLVAMGYLYVVSGAGLYQVDQYYNKTLLGTLATSTGFVSMVANQTQVAVFDSVGGYSWASGSFATISLPFSNPGLAAYMDGLAVCTQAGTFNLWQSNVNDLTTWGSLNFTTEDGSADNVVSIIEFHNQLVVFKQGFTCFYINAGLNGFVFQRLSGVYAETGCAAPNSVAKVDEAVLWLGQNAQGGKAVYMMKGYEPQRVSTHAIEYAIAQYSTVSDAVAFCYSQEGHKFYVLTFPTGNATWVLDLTATQKMGIAAWHQRAAFSNGAFSQYQAQTQAYFNGLVLVGDYQNGNIYSLNLDTYTDNGAPRKWVRSWRAVQEAKYEPTKFNFLEVFCETGNGETPTANPQLVLRYSDDSFSWSPELFQPLGAQGNTGNQIRWNRLGMTRRGLSSDRIFELSSTDPFKVALLAADIG
jgi:hypothetical protein